MSDILERLAKTIDGRRHADPATSHSAHLLSKGREKCAEKFGEEAIEAIIEAVKGDQDALTREAADVLYHLQVMLTASGVSWIDVVKELESRIGTSGIDEKASRS